MTLPASLAPALRAPGRVRAQLADAVRRVRLDEPVVRVEVAVEPQDALAWLRAQPSSERLYWRGRQESEAFAGSGVADEVVADDLAALHEALGSRLKDLPESARYVGTVRFAPERPVSAAWAPFGRIRFVLPRFELRTDGDRAMLAVHLIPGRDDPEAIAREVEHMELPVWETDHMLPLPVARHDAPDPEGWSAAIKWALDAFHTTPLAKVVLARRARFTFDEPLDPFALMRRLEAATPACYHALVGIAGSTFLSASPERLLRIRGRAIETEAVAGTRPRVASSAGDRRLRDELLASEKDRREHAYVRDALDDALAPLTETLDADAELSAMTLASGRHLYVGFRGTLHPSVHTLEVLQVLHPTPAVGGTPREDAMTAIARQEPFDRGLYAGPIGWVGRDAAEFAVGIRSGLVHGKTLDLYAGAGIVEGSEAGAEWQEIEHKMGDFARVLGLE